MKCANCYTDPCNECGCGKCKPAQYDCGLFDLQIDPFDPTKWKVTLNGVMHTINAPRVNETDTTLSTNYSNAILHYQAERHEDEITGEQIGSLINVKDLRDVDFDNDLAGTCYEFIYRKFNDCGEGCQSAADMWYNWNINSEGALQPSIRYVRGANVYGCPEYLNVPSNTNQYWFGMWDPTSKNGFTYVQPEDGELPKNENGDPIVLSTDENGKPIRGVIPLSCILGELMSNTGVKIEGDLEPIQNVGNQTMTFNPSNGNWTIEWDDAWSSGGTETIMGHGKINGRFNWTSSFDSSTGSIKYDVKSIYYDKVVWTHNPASSFVGTFNLLLKSVTLPGSSTQTIMNRYDYNGASSWSYTINRTVPSTFSVNVAPGQTSAKYRFCYIYVDATIQDDEFYTRVFFKNTLSGWGGGC